MTTRQSAILHPLKYLIEEAAPGVYALAVWDESWNSYNNCYVLRSAGEGGRAILIDSGKAEHAAALLEALARIGVTPDRVHAVLATHGHLDHIGGTASLPGVPRHLNEADVGLLPPALRAEWRLDLPGRGVLRELPEFQCVLLGHHTVGSVALFHGPTRALFWGDHVCFFGAPLDEGLVSFGAARRERMLRGVAWRRTRWPPDEAEQAQIRADLSNRAPEDQRRHDFPLQVEGLVRALSLGDPDILCTGHGPVLRGGIAAFLADLVAAARG